MQRLFLFGNKSLQTCCLKQHKQKELRKQTLSNFLIDCFDFHFVWWFSLRFFFLFFDSQRNSLYFLWKSFLTFIFIQFYDFAFFGKWKFWMCFVIFFIFLRKNCVILHVYLFSTLTRRKYFTIKIRKKSGKIQTLNFACMSNFAPFFLGLY